VGSGFAIFDELSAGLLMSASTQVILPFKEAIVGFTTKVTL
jgi:hypothetical protein